MSIIKNEVIYVPHNVFIKKHIEKQIVIDSEILIRYVATTYTNKKIQFDINSISNILDKITMSIFYYCIDSDYFQPCFSISCPPHLFKQLAIEEEIKLNMRTVKEMMVATLNDAQKELNEKLCLIIGM